jgi:hypothetical protein
VRCPCHVHAQSRSFSTQTTLPLLSGTKRKSNDVNEGDGDDDDDDKLDEPATRAASEGRRKERTSEGALCAVCVCACAHMCTLNTQSTCQAAARCSRLTPAASRVCVTECARVCVGVLTVCMCVHTDSRWA